MGKKKKSNSVVKLFSPKTKRDRKQLLFATRPPYPDRYIASLPENERSIANFIYETYMEKPWMGAVKMASYARMHGYSIGVGISLKNDLLSLATHGKNKL